MNYTISKIRILFEKFFFCCALTLCISLPAHANSMRVVVYGDSLTSGYQVQSNEAYSSKLYYKIRDIGYTNVEVINMGQPAQTTTRAAESIGEVIAKRPDIVVVQLGANDVLRGVSTDIIYKNLVDILGKLQQNRIYIILLGIKAPENTNPTYARQLDAVFQRLVTFYRVPYYPNTLEGIIGNADLSLADGYHPNGKGIDLIVENTFRMVDAGLRWKWAHLNEVNSLQETTGQALPPAMPLSVDPPAQPFGAR